ncbi:MAG: glycogen synthase GlgA [Clostridiaceae bacterium]
MKVLFASAEVFPFIKVGGLADVAYALPKALNNIGIETRVILPKYQGIPWEYRSRMEYLGYFYVKVGWRNQYCGLEKLELDGVTFYFLDNEYYFKRENTYGYYDDGERFSFFSNAVIEAISNIEDFYPDVIHVNDWHTAIIPMLLREQHHSLRNIKTVFTIHNLKYQGVYGKEALNELLGLDESFYREDSLKYYDAISFMKGGIVYSDFVTTVSPSYAEEIKTAYYGEGLNGLLCEKAYKLKGIVNGIDYDLFDPLKDKDIDFNYDKDSISEKVKNKLQLQKELGLEVNENIPMIGMVTRLVDQKGLDLLGPILHQVLGKKVQFVAVGTGEKVYEDMLGYFDWCYPNKMAAKLYYDSKLAQKVYAASDMYLMPSKFEPCGISQMIALKYGSLPIVRETGGLKDTVIPYNKYCKTGTGFTFKNYSFEDLLDAILRALQIYENKKEWDILVRNAMNEDNSWFKSAEEYKAIYENI